MSISRRDLFTFWRKPRAPVADDAPVADSGRQDPPRAPARLYLRPPGALAEADFLASCHRCGKCAQACPRQAIGPVVDEGAAKGTPFLVPRQAPCVVCDGLQCTHVCPSGALTPLDDKTQIRMGTAVLALERCVAVKGDACSECVRVCPIPGALLTTDGPRGVPVPAIDVMKCTGCGLCENYCPPEPAAIRVAPRRDASAPTSRAP